MRMLSTTIERRHTDAWNRLQRAEDEFYAAMHAYRAADRLLRQRQAEQSIAPELTAEQFLAHPMVKSAVSP